MGVWNQRRALIRIPGLVLCGVITGERMTTENVNPKLWTSKGYVYKPLKEFRIGPSPRAEGPRESLRNYPR